MSLLMDANAKCGDCGTTSDVKLALSINADRRPDLRRSIIDGTFQTEICPGCCALLRLPLHLSYLDLDRGQWILGEGKEHIVDWSAAEQNARAVFDQSYGADAPALARELGADLAPRLVFGWPALREKLVVRDLGLDDVTLELLKIDMIRRIPEPLLADETELRLTGGGSGGLRFAWIEWASETELASVAIGMDAYEAVAAAPIAWSRLRDMLESHLFVDLRRLIFA